MAVKVFFYTLRPYDEQGILEDLAKQRGIEYGYTEAYPTMENAQLAAGYDAVSLTPCDMSAPMLQRFHDLGVKAICCRSIGYDHVDLEKARELGMKVSNVDYPPNGVANFAIMLMLMSLRKAGHILKRGELQDYSLKGKIGRDISNCTVGVIGTGRIGQTVLKHLSGFGCELLAYDLYQNDEVKKIAKYVPLETLMAESDVITLHTNATEENHHLLNADAFAKMKPGVTIVNTARGKLIDSDALLAALESGQVGAAGLDVLENENGLYYYDRMGDVIPNPELAALRAMPNVILTDHTAFYTYEDVKRTGARCAGKCRRLCRGLAQPARCDQPLRKHEMQKSDRPRSARFLFALIFALKQQLTQPERRQQLSGKMPSSACKNRTQGQLCCSGVLNRSIKNSAQTDAHAAGHAQQLAVFGHIAGLTGNVCQTVLGHPAVHHGHGHAVALHLHQLCSIAAELGGQHTVVGAGAAAALHVTRDAHAGLHAGLFLHGLCNAVGGGGAKTGLGALGHPVLALHAGFLGVDGTLGHGKDGEVGTLLGAALHGLAYAVDIVGQLRAAE